MLSIVIYPDHNATTDVKSSVVIRQLSVGQVALRRSGSCWQSKIQNQNRKSQMPYLTTERGYPSSADKFGSKLKSVIETARGQVAELIGAHPRDVIFTSCATEAEEIDS